MVRSWFAAVALAVMAMGCAASAPPPIDVVGAPGDLRQLAGSWRGTFQNPQLRREGQIEFNMSATSDSATGDVTMYLESPSHPVWSRPSGGMGDAGGTPSGWRRIRFVRVEGGSVSGQMEEVYEPSCSCYVTATVLGRLRGSVIEGSYTSRSQDRSWQSSGSWRVERVADPATR